MTRAVEFCRYVRHADVPAYLALGWQAVPVGQVVHHDSYSRILVWPFPGDPVEPKKEKRA